MRLSVSSSSSGSISILWLTVASINDSFVSANSVSATIRTKEYFNIFAKKNMDFYVNDLKICSYHLKYRVVDQRLYDVHVFRQTPQLIRLLELLKVESNEKK